MISRHLESTSIRLKDKKLFVLDQTKLPHEEIWLESSSYKEMIVLIKQLKVRGAPAIAIAAALALALEASRGKSFKELVEIAKLLNNARPTAVNLMLAMDKLILKVDENTFRRTDLMAQALDLFDEDKKLCQKLGDNGSVLIKEGDRILTHCNTGGLATTGIGTALGVIFKAFAQKKNIHVYANETRPLLQGARLTSWELNKAKIPNTLICDNMGAHLMQQKKIQKVFVGADRIARNGDFANKIGTYNLAVLCHHHQIPFYVVAPYTTIDPQCPDGIAIPIEQREAQEVRGVSGAFGQVSWASSETRVYNPAFDMTPVNLISALITDKGIFTKKELLNGEHLL